SIDVIDEPVPVIVDAVLLLARIRPHVRRESRVRAINPGVNDGNNGAGSTRTQLDVFQFEKVEESLLGVERGDGQAGCCEALWKTRCRARKQAGVRNHRVE